MDPKERTEIEYAPALTEEQKREVDARMAEQIAMIGNPDVSKHSRRLQDQMNAELPWPRK